MTTANRDTRDVGQLAGVLRELVAAAIAARPCVEAGAEHYRDLLLDAKAADAVELLERLDAALADAGELLAEATS